MIQGLVQILIFQALGELISKFAMPFIPGPVIGLVLLLAFLSLRGHVPASIDLVGSRSSKLISRCEKFKRVTLGI
jgi:holin-like protein